MATDSPSSGDEAGLPDEAVTDFLGLLNEFKATGCSLLVVGDAGPDLFDRASATLLGDPESFRYRLLAATDATPDTVASRLPDPDQSPRPLAETTKVVDYAITSRSAASTADSPAESVEIPSGFAEITPDSAEIPSGPAEVSPDSAAISVDRASDLDELRDALVEGVESFDEEVADRRPATLRVGVDSVDALVERHGEDAVREWLESVGDRVRARDGMAHFVLRKPYENEHVAVLADAVDAVIEVRSVDAEVRGHDAQQRWHVPDLDASVGWVRL